MGLWLGLVSRVSHAPLNRRPYINKTNVQDPLQQTDIEKNTFNHSFFILSVYNKIDHREKYGADNVHFTSGGYFQPQLAKRQIISAMRRLSLCIFSKWHIIRLGNKNIVLGTCPHGLPPILTYETLARN